jgi:hypothetical protein
VAWLLCFQEHAALGDTKLVPTDELRSILLNTLVSALDTEGAEPKALREFSKWMLKHSTAVDTVCNLVMVILAPHG